MRNFIHAALLSLMTLFGVGAHAAGVQSIELTYRSVYDGDTIDVSYDALPEPLNKLRVRILGIDTPERGSKAKCAKEEAAAENARKFLEQLLDKAKTITVLKSRWDKYGGRILGDVQVLYAGKSRSVADLMIQSGYARAYNGLGQRSGWCGTAK